MGRNLSAIDIAHSFIRSHTRPGALCIDATAGRGRDTLLLSGIAGEQGKVLAFDIQQEALDSTQALVRQHGCQNVSLVLDSHENMPKYAPPGSVDCIVFNLGWLPGGDHSIFTRAASSIGAIRSGLELLKVGGIMSICIYYGKDCGYEERDALLAYLPTIDFKRFTIVIHDFCNRPNDPPIPVTIIRDA